MCDNQEPFDALVIKIGHWNLIVKSLEFNWKVKSCLQRSLYQNTGRRDLLALQNTCGDLI